MNKHVRSIKRQAGLTLVEALSFLALFGVVIAGAITLYGSGSNSASTNNLVSEVSGIKANAKAMRMAGVAAASVTTTTLANAGKLSKSMTDSPSAACGALAAPCAVYSDGTNFKVSATASAITVAVETTTPEMCESLLLSASATNPTGTPACASNVLSLVYN